MSSGAIKVLQTERPRKLLQQDSEVFLVSALRRQRSFAGVVDSFHSSGVRELNASFHHKPANLDKRQERFYTPNMKHPPKPDEIERRLITGLREKGYKLTPQRREIINILSNDTAHPGAMDILKKVRNKAPQISLSTVYYTLDILKNEGLIHELEFYDRDNRYDINISNHINLICKKCGKIEDFPGEVPLSFTAVKEKTDFQPVGIRFEYYGYCKACGIRKKR